MITDRMMKEIDRTADDVRARVTVSDSNENMNEIDEGLYSRQLYVMGREAQQRMSGAQVLLVGMNGLGAEVAKNVILAGVKAVTIVDDTLTSIEDLSSQFYLTAQDVGHARAQACASKLSELNQYVALNVHTGEVTESLIESFSVVVVNGLNWADAERINGWCRAHKVCFIMANVVGVFANVFCDFGEAFVVTDKDGERPSDCMIA